MKFTKKCLQYKRLFLSLSIAGISIYKGTDKLRMISRCYQLLINGTFYTRIIKIVKTKYLSFIAID